MSMFPDFNAIRRDQKEWQSEAKQAFVNGIDPADLRVGMKVTLSPNLRHGDRSYCTELLTVRAVNAGHVQLERERPMLGRKTIIIVAAEHHIYDASAFVVEAGEDGQ